MQRNLALQRNLSQCPILKTKEVLYYFFQKSLRKFLTQLGTVVFSKQNKIRLVSGTIFSGVYWYTFGALMSTAAGRRVSDWLKINYSPHAHSNGKTGHTLKEHSTVWAHWCVFLICFSSFEFTTYEKKYIWRDDNKNFLLSLWKTSKKKIIKKKNHSIISLLL